MVLVALEMSEELKTIKIRESAHKALQMAKVLDGIKIQDWVSVVILEKMEKDCPNTYRQLRDELIKEDN